MSREGAYGPVAALHLLWDESKSKQIAFSIASSFIIRQLQTFPGKAFLFRMELVSLKDLGYRTRLGVGT